MIEYSLLSADFADGPRCWIVMSFSGATVSTPIMTAIQARELAAKLTACADEMEAMS